MSSYTQENVPQAELPYIYHKKRGHLSTIKRGHILFPSQVYKRDTEISDHTYRIKSMSVLDTSMFFRAWKAQRGSKGIALLFL